MEAVWCKGCPHLKYGGAGIWKTLKAPPAPADREWIDRAERGQPSIGMG